jgi:phage protein U
MRDLIMMALGRFRFGVNRANYQTFSRNAPYRWAKQERLGRAPALQYLGPDTEEITLEGVIYPHFKGGLRQVELMRLIARQGVPLMLVDGLGFVWQRWCITTVDERRSFLMADGSPRKIEFSVSLQSYGGDLP